MDNGTSSNDSLTFPPSQEPYHKYMLYTTFVIQMFVITFGTFNNALFCFVIVRFPHLHTKFNALAFAVSAGDFLASAVATPVSIVLIMYHHRMHSLQTPICFLSGFLINLFKWSTVLTTTEIAAIRARCVFSSHLWLLSKRKIALIVVCNMLITAAFSTYRTYFSSHSVCLQMLNNKSRLLNIAVFGTLYVILVLCYAVLCIVTYRRSAGISRKERCSVRYEIATLRASAIIVTSYLILHLPYISYTLLLHFGVYTDRSYYSHSFFVSFFSLCNVADAITFFVTSKQYRKHVFLVLGTRNVSDRQVSVSITT